MSQTHDGLMSKGPTQDEQTREGLPVLAAGCPMCGRMQGTTLWSRHGFDWLRCPADGMAWVTPKLTEEAIGEVYRRLDARKQARHSPSQSAPPKRYLEILGRLASGTDGPGRILELGAFDGNFLAAAKDSGWQAYGTEINPAAAERARARGIEMHLGSLNDAPWPEGHFDAVALRDVLEHLPEARAELARIHRLLRPGGLLYIWVPNIGALTGRLLGPRWGAVVFPWHFNYFTATSLRAMLDAEGLRTESIASRNLLWRTRDAWEALHGRASRPGPRARRANRLAGRALAPAFALLDRADLHLGAQLEVYARRETMPPSP